MTLSNECSKSVRTYQLQKAFPLEWEKKFLLHSSTSLLISLFVIKHQKKIPF